MHAPGDRPRVSEAGENRPRLEVPLVGDPARTFQGIDGAIEVALSEGHSTHARQRLGESEWVVGAFRDPERLLGMRARIMESAQVRERQCQPVVRP